MKHFKCVVSVFDGERMTVMAWNLHADVSWLPSELLIFGHSLLIFLIFNPIASACEQGVELTLQCRHNERNGVSNHRRLDCLLNRLFRCRSKKTSKLRVTGLCEGESPTTGEFLAQRASNEEMFPFDDVIMTTNCRSWSTNVKIPLAPTTKIRMARVTLSFDLLTGKWSSPMGYICATNEYNPWNRRRHNWMTLRI